MKATASPAIFPTSSTGDIGNMNTKANILAVNCGSSSIKVGLYQCNTAHSLTPMGHGSIDQFDSDAPVFRFEDEASGRQQEIALDSNDHEAIAEQVIHWLEKQNDYGSIAAVGHRIVFGHQHKAPEIISPKLIRALKAISTYDPEHLPLELKWIDGLVKKMPAVTQVACFDTFFHDTMPVVAKLIALPRRFYNGGIQRYGFHGLSYAYLVQKLQQDEGEAAAHSKLIIAHLGSGSSVAAIHHGKSVDTSMGFTPASGIPMSTRTGDLDPGVVWYLMKIEKMNADQFKRLVNHESGLTGLSETSGDMRELLKRQVADRRAAEAVDFFCYQVKKQIGSFAAALGGVETLIFSGGIGEHAPEIRRRICDGLQFLGVELDENKNYKNETTISNSRSRVLVRVMMTDEQIMIAQLTNAIIQKNKEHEI